MLESTTAAHAPGTTVEARNLFLNLPVRRGFLGTVRSETYAENDENFLPRPPDS
jgi:DNA mismatch repair protein MutL